jgi:hypothetical protein
VDPSNLATEADDVTLLDLIIALLGFGLGYYAVSHFLVSGGQAA